MRIVPTYVDEHEISYRNYMIGPSKIPGVESMSFGLTTNIDWSSYLGPGALKQGPSTRLQSMSTQSQSHASWFPSQTNLRYLKAGYHGPSGQVWVQMLEGPLLLCPTMSLHEFVDKIMAF